MFLNKTQKVSILLNSQKSILKILTSLSKLSTESNIDILDFDSKLLQIASHVIYNSLSALFNESLITGQVPKDWKIARITPTI